MKAGKISEAQLKRTILKQLHSKRPEVVCGPAVGQDFSAIRTEAEELVVLSTDPVTGVFSDMGRRGVFRTLNNVAVSGARPIGVMVSVLVPTVYNEPQLRQLIKELEAACEEAKVQILGGHTQVSRAVKEPVITLTGVGLVKEKQLTVPSKVLPGMDIVVSKWIALEGTALLAKEKQEELRKRYAQPFIDKAQAFDTYLSIQSEAAVAVLSDVCAMHDVSEGGIFGALWEMAEASGVGLEIDLKKIPIRQETVEICEYLDINPYKLLSGGALLMATNDGNHLVRQIEKAGGCATVIGKATDSNDRVLLNEEERRFLETPQTDEILHIK